MKCPICDDVELLMSNRNGIEIDYCPKCRGVWLDRGELDKIIERSAAPVAPRQTQTGVQPQYQKPIEQGHGYGKKKKRESLFSELFDF